jgi:hypothetical protein
MDTNWTTAMTYRTYSGTRGSQAIAPLDKDRCSTKESDTLATARWHGRMRQ